MSITAFFVNILIKYSNKHPYHYLERKGYFHVHLFKLLLQFATEIYYIFLEVSFLFLFKGFLGIETFFFNSFFADIYLSFCKVK